MKDYKLYFVYGTLKEGHYNHRVLEGAEKIADHTTDPEFTMLHLGGFPGIYRGGNTPIKGEIYRVESDSTERRLDMLEGYTPGGSHNLYNKDVIDFDGEEAYIYVINTDRMDTKQYKTIEDGEWK